VIKNWVNAYLLSLATASAIWRRPAQGASFIFGDGQRKLATAAQRVSFIFGDGQRNLTTACATRIFYLWRGPAQVGDGQRNLFTPGNTKLGETSVTRTFFNLWLRASRTRI